MNSSEVNRTYFLSLDAWLSFIGSYPIYDHLYTYLITTLSLIALVLNFASLYVLTHKALFASNDFYKLMRVYTFNSIVLSFILGTTFLTVSYRFINISNSYVSTLYNVYVYTPLLSTLYLNGSLLEICIVIERISYFLPSKKEIIKKIGIKKLCIGLFLMSAIVSTYNYILYTPGHLDATVDAKTVYLIYFLNLTPFSLTIEGKVLAYAMYFTRDIITLLIKILLNTMSVILVRKYLTKLKKEKLTLAEKISTSTEFQNSTKQTKTKETYISKTDRNQTFVALIMCTFSLFEHALYIPSYVFYIMSCNDIAAVFYFMVLVFLALKQVANFFVLYKFNSSFRTELRKLLVTLKCASNYEN